MVSATGLQNNFNLNRTNEPTEVPQVNYVSCRGGNYERNPYADSYERKSSAGAVIGGVVCTLGIGSFIWALLRGKKVAPDQKFIKSLGEGYKDIGKTIKEWAIKAKDWAVNLFKNDAK